MRIVIIGNGIAGITAARHIRKRDAHCEILVVSAETEYFYSRTALMYIYMGHMEFEHTMPYEKNFWKKNRIGLVKDLVTSVDFDEKKLHFKSGGDLSYDRLLLATGSKSNMYGWPGQDLKGVQGLYSFQDLEALEKNTHPPNTAPKDQRVKRAVIVGGGLIGVEMAEMLHSRNIHVTFLVREDRFWGNVLPREDAALVESHLRQRGVEIKVNAELKEILGDEEGRASAVLTANGEEIACEFVALTVGVSPNVDFLRESSLEVDRGIMVNDQLQTNVASVYAAGDCAQFRTPPPGRRSIEQVWYTGRMMGEVAAENLLGGSRSYAPGPWFNSAKFFDLEYQTYGQVGNELSEGQQLFYWENQQKSRGIKVVFDKENGRFEGINSYGIRLRHERFDKWLRAGKSTDYIMAHLRDAIFDPEFYRDEVPGIVKAYNSAFQKDVKAEKRNWKRLLA